MGQKILMVLGMHRSGTSMLGQWLSACGLNLGDELLGKTRTNQFGHYEDVDFYKFHKKLLKVNHKSFLVTDTKPLKVPSKLKQEAENIVKRKSDMPQWGWKEPNTCLFMPLWDELLPDAYSIVIYRHYNEVVDSLYRRESNIKKRISKKEVFKRVFQYIAYNLGKNHYYNQFLKVWIIYNRDLLDYIKLKGQKHILIFEVDELIKRDDLIFEKLSGWGFDLTKTPISDVFSEDAMKRDSSWSNYNKNLQKEADAILDEFKKLKKNIL